MTAEPLEAVGLLVATGAIAAAVLGPGKRWQPLALAVALVAAPLLLLGDVWDEPRIEDLRSSPGILAAGALGLAVAVAVGAAIARRWAWAFPVAAFAALSLRVPLRIGDETSHLLIPLYLVVACGLVASLWGLVRARGGAPAAPEEPGAVVWLRRALAATVVLYALQALYSEDVSNAIENTCFFLVPFAALFCLLAEVRWERSTLLAVLATVVAVGSAEAAVALGQYAAHDLFLNQDLFESNQIKPFFRVNSIFFDPNVLGRYLALGIIAVGAGIAWSRGGWLAGVGLAAGVLLLVGLALSFSITSIAAMLLGLGVLAVLRYGLRGGVAAVAAILITAVVFALSGGADRTDIGPTRGIDEETSGRVDLIEGGVELVEAKPVQGWGSGSFGRAFYDEIRQTETTTSHSEPLTVAAEQGAPGVVVYLALLVAMALVLFGGGVRLSAGRAAAAAAMAVLVVHSIGYAGFLIDPATWAVLALAVGLRRPEAGVPAAED